LKYNTFNMWSNITCSTQCNYRSTGKLLVYTSETRFVLGI
jgi:hypothetical protein